MTTEKMIIKGRGFLMCLWLWLSHWAFANAVDSSTASCTVEGVTWSNGTTRYLAGARYVRGSVYGLCRNGTLECFLDHGIADSVQHRPVACDRIDAQRRRLALVVPNRANTWPKGVVCYEFVTTFTPENHQMILDAMNEFRTRSERLDFVPLDECKLKYGHDSKVCDGCTTRVQLRHDKQGCYASVGYQPSIQTIPFNVGEGCHTYGHYLHELGHLIGLGHEHCHPERKVIVLRDRLLIDAIYYSKDLVKKPLIYDPTSIMHYRERSICMPHDRFASVKFCDVNETASKHQCVVPVEAHCDPSKDQLFGFRKNLTDLDIQAIRYLYTA